MPLAILSRLQNLIFSHVFKTWCRRGAFANESTQLGKKAQRKGDPPIYPRRSHFQSDLRGIREADAASSLDWHMLVRKMELEGPQSSESLAEMFSNPCNARLLWDMDAGHPCVAAACGHRHLERKALHIRNKKWPARLSPSR